MLAITDIIFIALSFVNVYFLVLFFIVFGLERKNIRKLPQIKNLPFVSVIIPVYNKEKEIAKTIEAAKGLNYPKSLMEIIAVDDGSTDGSGEILKKISGIRLYRKENQGCRAYAINYGIAKAKGEIIACVDADSYPEKDSLIKAVQFFEDKDVAGVTASVLVRNANNLMRKLQKMEYALILLSRKLMESINCIYVTPGPLALYRKGVIKKLGGFDVKNMTEDIEIAWRLLAAGYKIKMSLDSKVYSDVPATIRDWWNQRIRWNVGGTQTALKYSGHFFKVPSNVGMFILPLFMLSYVLTFLGVALMAYLASSALYNFAFIYLRSALLGANLLNFSFSFNPDILTVAGIAGFAISMLWLKFSFGALKGEISMRNLPEFLIYLLFYISVHPFNLLASTWKMLKKDYKW